jgi:hypothetical protein
MQMSGVTPCYGLSANRERLHATEARGLGDLAVPSIAKLELALEVGTPEIIGDGAFFCEGSRGRIASPELLPNHDCCLA